MWDRKGKRKWESKRKQTEKWSTLWNSFLSRLQNFGFVMNVNKRTASSLGRDTTHKIQWLIIIPPCLSWNHCELLHTSHCMYTIHLYTCTVYTELWRNSYPAMFINVHKGVSPCLFSFIQTNHITVFRCIQYTLMVYITLGSNHRIVKAWIL